MGKNYWMFVDSPEIFETNRKLGFTLYGLRHTDATLLASTRQDVFPRSDILTRRNSTTRPLRQQ